MRRAWILAPIVLALSNPLTQAGGENVKPVVPELMKREVSPEGMAYLQKLRKRTPFGTNDFNLEALRAGMGSRREPTIKGVKLIKVKVGDIPCEWVLAPGADPDVRLLYIHGGGFVSGSGGFYLAQAAHISAAAKCALLLPDYRLAPEHRFPAGLDDCVAAHQWMVANGPGGSKLARATFIAGDSAGGSLTLTTLLALADRKMTLPAGGIPISPCTDFTLASDSLKTVHDPIISAKTMPVFRDHYLGKADPRNPLASPVFGDYRGIPPLLIQIGEHEMLRDDGIRVAKKARADGISVRLEVWPGMFHVFQSHEPLLPEAREAIDHIGEFIRARANQAPPAKRDRMAKTRADLKSPQVDVRRAAIRSLVHSDLSEPLREEIQAALADKDAEVRATAATAVGNLGAAAVSAIPSLIRQMQNDSAKEARETAARALGRIGKAAPKERQAVPSLRQTADKDADPVTRTVALGALAMMDVDVSGQVVALRKFLHHDRSLVRMKAAHALGMIGLAAKSAGPEIVTVLERSTDPHERGYIARALGNTGDPASLPALQKAIAKETDNGARGEMNGAISRLVRLAGESDSWPQFRGPGSAASAVGNKALPTEIGPKQYVLWKTPLPPGHSSPVIHGDRIFLTGVADKKLFTIGLDRMTGKEAWRTEAPHKVLEKVHKIGNPAQATPATDGRHVVVFFGSAGLFCYDRDGKELWHKPMGPFKTEFGAASSPLLVDGRVVLNQDYDGESSLSVYDVKSGKRIWIVDRNEFGVGYASPVIWEVAGKKQIVQAGTLRVVGYDLDTGNEIWTARGMSRICNMTPTVGPGNILYVAGWGAGADPGDIIAVPTFDDMLKKHDANKNGVLEANEIPAGPIKDRLPQFDRNRDGKVDRAEWESMRNVFASAKNRMVAIRPGGTGDITRTHVLWEQKKQLPYVPSPLIYNDLIFLVKNGGLISALDPKTGRSLKYDRVQAGGNYYSSPVGGDGKVYLLSQQGELTVISARADWEILHTANFGEEIFATPALVNGRIYLRTANYLYCFSSK